MQIIKIMVDPRLKDIKIVVIKKAFFQESVLPRYYVRESFI